MAANKELGNAKKNKKDEFYTTRDVIDAELRHYTEHFRNKTVLCNCDDPYESNFFKYFAMNFEQLGLKKLSAASYRGSPIAGTQLSLFDEAGTIPLPATAYKIELTGVTGIHTLDDVSRLVQRNVKRLKGDGDFRSDECIKLLKQADIVVTNPPFSLFREYVAQLIEYNKQFLIIGNVNAITYKDIFPLIKNDRLWLGVSIHSGDREFRIPDDYPLEAAGCRVDKQGCKYIRVKGVRWFTNLDNEQRHEELLPYRTYEAGAYLKYDNYDAIEVGEVKNIPKDYSGVMGVPITFLDKHNPDQFEIVGLIAGNIKGLAGLPSKSGKDGPYIDGKLKYGRILIKRKAARSL